MEEQNKCSLLEIPDLSKGKTLLDVMNEKTLANNEDFSKMSQLQKRVVLAKDVIAQIKLKNFTIRQGIYVSASDGNGRDIKAAQIGKEGVDCTVCAIGSLFVAHSMKTNSKTLLQNGINHIKTLEGIYTHREMRLFEYLFERHDIHNTFTGEEDLKKDVVKFRKANKGSENRLIKIMENIIENEGNFKYEGILI